MISRKSILLALCAVAISGCATTSTPVSVADTVARTPQLSTLNRLIAAAGLTEALRGPGPITLFAPSDDAFKAVPEKTLKDLAANPAQLKTVLSYHAVSGNLTSATAKNENIKSLAGPNLSIAKAGGFVTVEDAMVTSADTAATNGTVHIIDRVLMPPR